MVIGTFKLKIPYSAVIGSILWILFSLHAAIIASILIEAGLFIALTIKIRTSRIKTKSFWGYLVGQYTYDYTVNWFTMLHNTVARMAAYLFAYVPILWYIPTAILLLMTQCFYIQSSSSS